MTRSDDPVLRHSRREAAVILAVWAGATLYCCLFCYAFGYIRDGKPPDDPAIVLGMPWWFFCGVVIPWLVCGAITLLYCGFFMVEDDLGSDHSEELDRDIREEAALDGR